ncbi:MAG: FMN-binding glutamate synthase family protein, partial [Gammaproteobacteria bacterium]|nr:FMN-binding glutamate synthase family protein [Gammaproteobacteria bacterium]
LLGSMGLESPEALTPAHIIRRVDNNEVKPLSQVYTYLESGQLLGKKIPDEYKVYWDASDADRF